MRKQIFLTIIWAFSVFLPISLFADMLYTAHANRNAYDQRPINFNQCVQQKQQNRDAIHDSLVTEWIAANDTTLRKFEKTIKIPHTYCTGYWKRTGRLECEPSYNGKMICKPESTYVETTDCDIYYTKDTVWSKGWESRDEWVFKANYDARNKLDNTIYSLCETEFPYFAVSNGPHKSICSTLGILEDGPISKNKHPYISVFMCFVMGFGIPWVVFSPFMVLPSIWRKKKQQHFR